MTGTRWIVMTAALFVYGPAHAQEGAKATGGPTADQVHDTLERSLRAESDVRQEVVRLSAAVQAKRQASEKASTEAESLRKQYEQAATAAESSKAIAAAAPAANKAAADKQAADDAATAAAAKSKLEAAVAAASAKREELALSELNLAVGLKRSEELEAEAIRAAAESVQAQNEADAKAAVASKPPPPKHSVDTYLEARCASALCFGGDNWLGIEPLVELPIAKTFAIGNSSLAHYINNHDITLQLAAGIRVWVFRDLLSIASYLSVPLSSSAVRVEGSDFTYPGASIRRPYPGVAIGLLYDIVWVGIDHDELRNGDSSDASAYNPEYPSNGRVSSCTTISIALQPVTAARALFGAVRNETTRGGKD